MKITHYNIIQQKCPFWEQWKDKDGDLELYAFRFSEFIRAFSEPVIRYQLSQSMEGKEKREGEMDRICDMLYTKIRYFITNAPDRYVMSRIRIELILEKSGD